MFARAGFDIDWIDDTKATGKHPEFIATHRQTQQKVGVETKSRKRQGSYNFAGTVSPETHLKGDVFGLYETATKQSPQGGLPFLIFIDANVPDTIPAGTPGYSDFPVDAVPWMKEIRDGLVAIWQASEQPSSESAVFVTDPRFLLRRRRSAVTRRHGQLFPFVEAAGTDCERADDSGFDLLSEILCRSATTDLNPRFATRRPRMGCCLRSCGFRGSRPRLGHMLDGGMDDCKHQDSSQIVPVHFLDLRLECSRGVEYLLRRAVQFHAPLSCRDLAAMNRDLYPLPT